MVWEAEFITARIAGRARRMRYEAGSPNAGEVEVYRDAFPAVCVERCGDLRIWTLGRFF